MELILHGHVGSTTRSRRCCCAGRDNRISVRVDHVRYDEVLVDLRGCDTIRCCGTRDRDVVAKDSAVVYIRDCYCAGCIAGCNWVCAERDRSTDRGDVQDLGGVVDIKLDVCGARKISCADEIRPVVQLPALSNKRSLVLVDSSPSANLFGKAVPEADKVGVKPATAVCISGGVPVNSGV